MSLEQNFTPNNKTLEYINILLTSKFGNVDTTEKLRSLAVKVNSLTDLRRVFNSEIIVDRNMIIQLQILRNLTLEFQEQRKNNKLFSPESVRVFKEIVPMLDIIESNFNRLKENACDILLIRPTELFHLILNANTKSLKVFDKYVELALEYIAQLEYMSYAVINYIDELDFDIHSYSSDFFNILLSIPPKTEI